MKLVFVFKLSVNFSEPEYKSTLQQIEGKSLRLELVSTWSRMSMKYGICLTLSFHGWQRENLSLQYQCNIKQTWDENKEKYQLGEYLLIQYQVLQTNIIKISVAESKENYWWDLGSERVNPFHPNISMHILHTVLFTFPKLLTRRIYWSIKSFFGWW